MSHLGENSTVFCTGSQLFCSTLFIRVRLNLFSFTSVLSSPTALHIPLIVFGLSKPFSSVPVIYSAMRDRQTGRGESEGQAEISRYLIKRKCAPVARRLVSVSGG